MSSNDFSNLIARGKVPFILGTTGHIDLADSVVAERALVEVFSELLHEMPDTPFIFLNALAEGSDRIFIATAKKILGKRAKWVAIIPFDAEEYLKDFMTQGSKVEFRALLNDSLCTIEASKGMDISSNRDEGYGLVGDLIVKHANMLIAIWDGKMAVDSDGRVLRGGTSDLIDGFLNRRRDDVATFLEPSKTMPVLHVVAERKIPKGNLFFNNLGHDMMMPGNILCHFPIRMEDEQTAQSVVCRTNSNHWLYSVLNSNTRQFGKILSNIQKYNMRIVSDMPHIYEKIKISISWLGVDVLNESQSLKLADVDRHGICDALAMIKQTNYKRVLNSMFFVSILTGILAQIYGGILMTRFLLSCYLAGLVLVYCLYVIFIQKLRIDRIYHDYRALAEALRVQIYWRLAGISDNVENYFLRRQRGELEWLRLALQNWHFLDTFSNEHSPRRVDLVQKVWIEGQLNYYKGRRTKCLNYSRIVGRIASVCYFASLTLAVLFVFCGDSFQFLEKYGGFWVGIGPFVLAVLCFYQDKVAWGEHAEAYTRTGRMFLAAKEKIHDVDSNDESKTEIIHKLGQEALVENSEWILLHRKRAPEPMK